MELEKDYLESYKTLGQIPINHKNLACTHKDKSNKSIKK